MINYKRVHLVVLDSVGIGEAPDAINFDDEGADTLGNIDREISLNLPNLEKLGLGNIKNFKNIKKTREPKALYTKLFPESIGKDTMTGHWELMGEVLSTSFQTFSNGFPKEIIDKIENYSGRKVVCNLPYSGTEVLEDYGEQHIEDGNLIVYTSTDSVLQIAAHEEIITRNELYDICEYAREITFEAPNKVGRIIARPFIGEKGNFIRTDGRMDYALSPPNSTVLDYLKDEGLTVWGIGKIFDIFNGHGITHSVRTKDNMDGVNTLIEVMKEDFTGLSFTNLVDFDMLYGHRRDVQGYGSALKEFDDRIPEIIENMTEKDLLIITADHGNDPTFKGTDHTREYVPLIIFSYQLKNGGKLPINAFSSVGQLILDNFDIGVTKNLDSLLEYII